MAGTMVGRGTAGTLWWSQGWLHSDPECPLLDEDRREVPRSARGERCVCLVVTDVGDEVDPRRVRGAVSAELLSSVERDETSWWDVVSAMAVGLESGDPLVVRARGVAAAHDDTAARTRAAVARALNPGKSRPTGALWGAASALERTRARAVRGLEPALRPTPRDLERWASTWVGTGDVVAARRALLSTPTSLTGSEGGDGVSTRAAWTVVGELLEAAARQMTELLARSEPHCVLVHDWHALVEGEGDEATWAALGAHEYVLCEREIGLLVPAHVAEWLEERHGRGPSHHRVRRAVDLGPAGPAWRASLETMRVIWRDAGGSFRLETDVYGEELRVEGPRDPHVAYQAARALEE